MNKSEKVFKAIFIIQSEGLHSAQVTFSGQSPKNIPFTMQVLSPTKLQFFTRFGSYGTEVDVLLIAYDAFNYIMIPMLDVILFIKNLLDKNDNWSHFISAKQN